MLHEHVRRSRTPSAPGTPDTAPPTARAVLAFAAFAACVALPGGGAAQTAERTLVVGTKQAPPFAIRHDDGTWSGISIDLWRGLAADLEATYELRELDLPGLLTGLEEGSLDVAVAALTLSQEREIAFDFSHPFYTSGLGIAVTPTGTWLGAAASLLSPDFLRAVLLLLAVLALAGFAVWLFERRANDEEFGGSPARGLGSAFWWSAVTMTTVGYGDKAPRTAGGRLVALVWMFTSIVIISGLTAAIASALTVGRLKADIQGPRDLTRFEVGVVARSTSETAVRDLGAETAPFDTLHEALQALGDGRVGAVVHDAPILRHEIRRSFGSRLRTLPAVFGNEAYAFGLPAGSALREPLNRALLVRVDGPAWRDLLERHVGE